MRIKTSKLIGPALNWAVDHCEGLNPNTDPEVRRQYSTDWAQGGPIIEREGIAISQSAAGLHSWLADMPLKPTSFADKTRCSGTPLIAAMRCYVTSRLGDEIDVPEELLWTSETNS